MSFTLVMLTDLHYTPEYVAQQTRMCADSLRKVEKIQPILQKADLCVQLGDLINGTGNPAVDSAALKEAIGALAPYGTRHVIGNHDAFALDKSLILPHKPGIGCVDHFSFGGVDFITLDANFCADGSEYSPTNGEWTDTAIPPFQLEWLRHELLESNGAVIFCHQNLDDCPDDPHVVRNAADVRTILEQSGKVRCVFQGHCHAGRDTVTAGIRYHTLPAVCERERIPYCVAEISGWDHILISDGLEHLAK